MSYQAAKFERLQKKVEDLNNSLYFCEREKNNLLEANEILSKDNVNLLKAKEILENRLLFLQKKYAKYRSCKNEEENPENNNDHPLSVDSHKHRSIRHRSQSVSIKRYDFQKKYHKSHTHTDQRYENINHDSRNKRRSHLISGEDNKKWKYFSETVSNKNNGNNFVHSESDDKISSVFNKNHINIHKQIIYNTPTKIINGSISFLDLPKLISPIADTPDHIKKKYDGYNKSKNKPVVPMINPFRDFENSKIVNRNSEIHSEIRQSNSSQSCNDGVTVTPPFKNCHVLEIKSTLCNTDSTNVTVSKSEKSNVSVTDDVEHGIFNRKGRKRPIFKLPEMVTKT